MTTEKEIIKEFQKFRREKTKTCNAIRLDEVAQFVLYKLAHYREEGEEQNRKIDLPNYCHPLTGGSYGGDPNCDHDFPPESKNEKAEYVCWTCSKCGMKRCYDVND